MSYFHSSSPTMSPRKTAKLTREASQLRAKATESLASLSCIMYYKIQALEQALHGSARLDRTLHSKKSPPPEQLQALLPALTQDYHQLIAYQQSGEQRCYARTRKSLYKQLSVLSFRDTVERECATKLANYASGIEQQYGADVHVEPDLTLIQLRQRLADYHALKQREHAVYEQLVEGHLALVVSIASQQYHSSALSLDDLIQEGAIGLLAAVKEFDAERGHCLSTFATPIIQQHITRALYNKERPIRLPVQVEEEMHRVRRALSQLEQEGKHSPTLDQIAALCQLPSAQVSKLLDLIQRPAPRCFEELSDSTHALYSAQGDSPTPYDTAVQNELYTHLAAYLPQLDETSRRIIELRYGLLNGHLYSHQQIADHLSLSRSRVMRMEKEALRCLRDFFNGL